MLGVTPVDVYHWVAHLDDGTAICEQAPDGTLRGWGEVDARHVITVELAPVAGGPSVLLEVPPGATAWLGRRRSVRLVQATGATVYDGAVTLVCWRTDDRAIWLYVRDDGLVAVSDREVA